MGTQGDLDSGSPGSLGIKLEGVRRLSWGLIPGLFLFGMAAPQVCLFLNLSG